MAKKNKSKNRKLKNIRLPKSESDQEHGFNPDYSDVIKDLKRIGILAGTFFLILIVLSFIL